MAEESSPVVFPGINYQWKGLYAYAMGGYAINGKYAEVDLGLSYSWKGLTIGFNDYYYPTISGKDDEYLGGKHNGHWLEASLTYAPENIPLWLTVSNFLQETMTYMTMLLVKRNKPILPISKLVHITIFLITIVFLWLQV